MSSAPTQREVEVKLTVHGLFVLPELLDPSTGNDAEQPDVPDLDRVAAVAPGRRLTLRAVYHDTPDLRLARSGLTLRHRTGEGPAVWTLKIPAAAQTSAPVGQTSRDELTVPGQPTSVPPALAEALIPHLRGAQAVPVAVLRTDRQVHLLLDPAGDPLAEVVDDTVSVLEGRRLVSRFRELEVERATISDAALVRVLERLQRAGAVAGDPLPKVVRALGPRATDPPDLPAPGPVSGKDPAAAVVTLSLRSGTRRLLANDAGVRAGEEDAVHQMRVASRRMRSDLRTFGPLVEPDWAEPLAEELAWLAGELGAARDLEVLRERLAATAAADPLSPLPAADVATIDRLLGEQEHHALVRTREALRSPRYVALLDRLVEAAHEPGLTAAAEQRADRALPPLVAAAWAELAKGAGKLTLEGPDEQWHTVRKRAKRARYAAEAVQPALGKGAAAVAAAATAVQTQLGDHQDAATAAETIESLPVQVPGDVGLAVTAGRLVERERAAITTVRQQFPAAWKQARSAVATGSARQLIRP